jgi:hypothetical protein
LDIRCQYFSTVLVVFRRFSLVLASNLPMIVYQTEKLGRTRGPAKILIINNIVIFAEMRAYTCILVYFGSFSFMLRLLRVTFWRKEWAISIESRF